MGTREIFLTGEGEPMLHPQLIEIIDAFKRAGFKVSLFTNGTLLTPKKADKLLDSGLDVLKTSFWAVDSQEHKKCHPGVNPELLDKRIEGLRYLGKSKKERNLSRPEINLAMIFNQHNFRNISGRVRLAKLSGCDSVSFGVFRDHGGLFQELALAPPDVISVRHELIKAKENLSSLSVDLNLEDYLPHAKMGYRAWKEIPCYAGWFQAYIKVDGNVMLCPHCNKSVGKLNDQSFATIWNGSAHREFRRQGFAPDGLVPLDFGCDCANCCIIKDNLKVHRKFMWLTPFLALYQPLKKYLERSCRC
jgi:MoaA/NifB/PqqE/SkfB family radical SAM enzyme